MTPRFPDKVKRYCPDAGCPSHSRRRKAKADPRGRYLGESAIGAYARFYCPDCKTWWTWNGELRERDTLVLEDKLE